MNINNIAYIAVEAGRIILENGGETYRVEETINKICTAYNIEHADSFVTPTGIMMSVVDSSGKNISIVKRIKTRTVNLEKIHRINDLSRNIKKMNYSEEEIVNLIKEIDNLPRYSELTTLIFSALVAASFTLIFGGNLKDSAASFIIGASIRFISSKIIILNINSFFINILGGFIAGFFALIFFHLKISSNLDVVIIGSIMLLVPGISITNAIRDTLSGDFVAGMARALESILIAVGIAIGTAIIFKIWIGIFGGLI